MADDFRSKFDPTRSRGDGDSSTDPSASPTEEDGEYDDTSEKAYSLVSADRRQKLMLEFRFKTGNATALAYSYLVSVEIDPSRGIVMDFSGYEVTLGGRNLSPLFSGLVAQRVAVVRETDELQAEATLPQGATVVTRIEISTRT